MKNHDKCILNKTVKNFNKSLAWAHAQIWEVYYSVGGSDKLDFGHFW